MELMATDFSISVGTKEYEEYERQLKKFWLSPRRMNNGKIISIKDLKEGMVCTTREGESYTYLGHGFSNTKMTIEDFSDNLRNRYGLDWDIVNIV